MQAEINNVLVTASLSKLRCNSLIKIVHFYHIISYLLTIKISFVGFAFWYFCIIQTKFVFLFVSIAFLPINTTFSDFDLYFVKIATLQIIWCSYTSINKHFCWDIRFSDPKIELLLNAKTCYFGHICSF